MEDNEIIIKKCELLLRKYPDLRSAFRWKQFVWKYWSEIELGFIDVAPYITEKQFCQELTSSESILRARRKVLELHPDLRGDTEIQIRERELAERHRQNYLQFKEGLNPKDKKNFEAIFDE